MQVSGQGDCLFHSTSVLLTGREGHHAHLRLATAVFAYTCGWQGIHPDIRKHILSQQIVGDGMPERHILAFEIAWGYSADLEAVAMLGGVLQLPILHLHPGAVGSAATLYDETARAAVSAYAVLWVFIDRDVPIQTKRAATAHPSRVSNISFVPCFFLACRLSGRTFSSPTRWEL